MSAVAAPAHRMPPALRRALFVLAGLAAVLMVVFGALNVLDLAARNTTTQTATYAGVRAIEIDDAADIRLLGAPAGAPLRVSARVTEGLRAPDRTVQRDADGTLRLASSCPLFFGGNCGVRYEVRVPAGTQIRADASAGDIVAEGVVSRTPLELESSAGDVSAIDVEAPALRLSSSAGDVLARGISAERIIAESSAGDVMVSVREPAALLDANSSAGDVELVVPDAVYRLDAGSSAGDVGSAEVRIDPDAARAIAAHSSAGDVRIDVRR